MTSAAAGNSTLPSIESGTTGWEHVLRMVSVGVIAALVIAGLTGLLGVRTASVIGSGNGYEIEVTYASITRPGLATPFEAAVRTLDGSDLPSRVIVRIDAPYLAMFDENGLDPEPSDSYRAGGWTWWTFEIPEGSDELVVSFDARLEPAVQWGQGGSAAIVDGETELAIANFRTLVIP
jgi:hypothetical protein